MVSIDTVSGQLVLRGMLAASWVDEYLTWNQSENGIDRLSLYDEKIWEPHFEFYRPTSVTLGTVMQVFSSGVVVLTILADFETYCDLNMRLFPMDSHYCSIAVMSNGNLKEYVTLSADDDGIFNMMLPHGEWTVDETFVIKETFKEPFTSNGIDVLKFTLLLSRRHEFSLLHKGAPQCLLMFANIFAHLVPVNSGERVSFAVTLFLAFVFWQTIVIDDLPENSVRISYFSIILTFCMTMSTLSLVLSIVLTKMSVETDKPIPGCLHRLAVFMKKMKRKRKHPIHEFENERVNDRYTVDVGKDCKVMQESKQDANDNRFEDFHNDSVIDKLKTETKDYEKNKADETVTTGGKNNDLKISWLDVVEVIDVILFWASIATIMIALFIFNILFHFGPN